MARLVNLGAPAFLERAALSEALLTAFGGNFPITLFLTNQTPSAQEFAQIPLELKPEETKPFDFESQEQLLRWSHAASQVGYLLGFETAFVISDEAPTEAPSDTNSEVATDDVAASESVNLGDGEQAAPTDLAGQNQEQAQDEAQSEAALLGDGVAADSAPVQADGAATDGAAAGAETQTGSATKKRASKVAGE